MIFDQLFTDPRHFRSDCRSFATAIRHGRLDHFTPEQRAEARDQLFAALEARKAAGFATTGAQTRVLRAWGEAVMAMDADNLRAEAAQSRPGGSVPLTGRPRECWRVEERRPGLDANAVARQAKEMGRQAREVSEVIVGAVEGVPGSGERVGVVTTDSGHLRLTCPRCGSRRRFLYPVRAGMRCRSCAGLIYADGRGLSDSRDIPSGDDLQPSTEASN